jgi:hypothetical protein
VLGGGAGGPCSRDRSLLNTITVIKAKGRRARRRGPPGSR